MLRLQKYLAGSAMFEDVDMSAVLKIVAVFIVSVSLIYSAIVFRRYRKVDRRVTGAMDELARLDVAFGSDAQKVVERIIIFGEDGAKDNDEMAILAYRVPRTHITMRERIAKGACGEVWVGTCNGSTVAIKRMYMRSKIDVETIKRFKQECATMAKLQSNGISHPNIAQMMYCCWTSSLLLVIDFYPLGSIKDVISVARSDKLAYGEALGWKSIEGDSRGVLLNLALGVCDGMSYMHSFSPSMLHLDLKTENILIDANFDTPPMQWAARVSDFGTATSIDALREHVQGTYAFMAPELFAGERASTACDVYAFGMSLADIAARLEGSTLAANGSKVDKSDRCPNERRGKPALELTSDLEWLGDLIGDCCAHSPKARPASFEIVRERILRACSAANGNPATLE